MRIYHDLKNKISRLIDDEHYKKRLSDAIYEYAKERNHIRVADSFLNLIKLMK